MNRDELHKLAGGYATGTLTGAERALLFEAALEDQDLFNELASEQALKELLEEPSVRARLAAALAPREAPRGLAWWMRPWPVAGLGAAAVVALVAVAVVRTPEVREIAAVTPAPVVEEARGGNAVAPEAAAQAPAPAPARAAARPPVERQAGARIDSVSEKPRAETPAPPPPAVLDRKEEAQVGAVQSLAAPPAAPAKPQVFARAAAPLNTSPAFTWSIENGVLRVTPARDGVLRIEAPPREPLVVGNARSGVVTEFALPADASAVRVSFSASNVFADAVPVIQRGASGTAFAQAGAPDGPVSVEIPLK